MSTTTRSPRRRVQVRWVLLGIAAGLIGLYLILPTLFIIPMSLTESPTLGQFRGGWTLHWYQQLIEDPVWGRTALVSLQVGLIATVFATVLGTAAAMGITKASKRVRGLIQGLTMAPMIIPAVIVGIGLYVLFLKIGLYGTLLGFAIGHTVICIPFVMVAVGASIAQFDPNQVRAASILGAGPVTTFFRVTLPQIMPGVIAGALFAFVTSWDEVVVSTFLVSPRLKTLPVEMWTQSRTTLTPTLAALSTVLMIISTLALVGLTRLQKGSK
ncbi:ABC transporter permease [Pseudoclavibacter soli]|uniref:ABC transporter permease n=1 Tax=Pseudoclavibacter soli TaxID=452623 RepID=UPI0003FAE93B|nr:ABC transporter permease [Pseudoclavibacter soli]